MNSLEQLLISDPVYISIQPVNNNMYLTNAPDRVL